MTRTAIEFESFARHTHSTRVWRAVRCSLAIIAVALLACGSSGIRAEKHPPAKPIDLNAANAKELQELPGVGPVTAKRIIDLRGKNGRFKRVEDLLAVRGISQKKLDAMRPYVMVSAAPPTQSSPAQKTPSAAKKASP